MKGKVESERIEHCPLCKEKTEFMLISRSAVELVYQCTGEGCGFQSRHATGKGVAARLVPAFLGGLGGGALIEGMVEMVKGMHDEG